ncbi:MAG: hypothetical protein LUD81_11085, partial [Clostridiales bacterium]|nr:hypothetical protein [Clostridiales bacterium]
FTEVVNRFRKDLDELRLYAFTEKAENEERQAAESPVLDAGYLFRERPEYIFNECEGYFVKICPNDLSLIDDYMYKYADNPTVRAAYLRFGCLLLGKTEGELMFCLPDVKREFKDAERLGFTDFREAGEDKCFRIMKITKENEYENKKKELDGRRA